MSYRLLTCDCGRQVGGGGGARLIAQHLADQGTEIELIVDEVRHGMNEYDKSSLLLRCGVVQMTMIWKIDQLKQVTADAPFQSLRG